MLRQWHLSPSFSSASCFSSSLVLSSRFLQQHLSGIGWSYLLLSPFAYLPPLKYLVMFPFWKMLRPLHGLCALHQTVLCCFVCVPLVLRLSTASAVLHTAPETSVLLHENGLVREGAVGLKACRGTPGLSNTCSGWATSQLSH